MLITVLSFYLNSSNFSSVNRKPRSLTISNLLSDAIDPDKDVRFVMQGNRRKLYVKDHCYYRKHTLKGHTQWRCTEYRAYGCLASVKILRNGSQMFLQGVHDHPVKKEHRQNGQLKQLMQQRNQIVSERKQQRQKRRLERLDQD